MRSGSQNGASRKYRRHLAAARASRRAIAAQIGLSRLQYLIFRIPNTAAKILTVTPIEWGFTDLGHCAAMLASFSREGGGNLEIKNRRPGDFA
jgi:hypothetical protein